MPGRRIVNRLKKKVLIQNEFAASFMHLEGRGVFRKITQRWEKARWGSDYRIVNKITCS